MTESGERLIKGAHDLASAARSDLDTCMLQSMATALRHGLEFSFNNEDMAELLERVAADRLVKIQTDLKEPE